MSAEDYQNIALDMESLQFDLTARPGYDLMSDSLVWPDEIPRGRRSRELWCLRPVLRFRTGIILGIHFSEFQMDWDTAKSVFPNWIGFRACRTAESASLQLIYHELSKK